MYHTYDFTTHRWVEDGMNRKLIDELNKKIKEQNQEFVNKTKDINNILKERGSRYGEFKDQASITQNLKEVMVNTENWSRLKSDQKEALEMVQHKIARILNGDPNYIDSWEDIVGYTQLIVNRLKEEKDGQV